MKKVLAVSILLMIALSMSNIAADDGNDNTAELMRGNISGEENSLGITEVLSRISAELTGPVARLLGVIMIVFAGLMIAFTEGQAIKRFLWVIVGIGVSVNVPQLMSALGLLGDVVPL